jgi:hypothetical protein
MLAPRFSWLSGLLALACVLAGCSRSYVRGRAPDGVDPDVEPADPPEPPDISVPPPASAQDPLAELAVAVELFDADADPNGPAAGQRNLFAYVWINGGTREGRVPDLRVFQNGTRLNEVGSAGLPQQFNYQGKALPSEVELGLRFARDDVSFLLHFSASDVEISAPAEAAELTSGGDLVVTWSGVEQRPAATSIGADPPERCPLTFRRSRVDPQQAVYFLDSLGDDPPERCAAELSMSWNIDEPAPDAPFASLKVTRRVQRVRHFGVQLKR